MPSRKDRWKVDVLVASTPTARSMAAASSSSSPAWHTPTTRARVLPSAPASRCRFIHELRGICLTRRLHPSSRSLAADHGNATTATRARVRDAESTA